MKKAGPYDLEGGHFAKKQIYCKDLLISWSHRRRFQIGLDIARGFAGKRVLDYGCGDGTFLAMLMTSPGPPGEAVGAELDERVIEDCRRRFEQIDALGFCHQSDLKQERDGRFDVVFCMEVLEHVVDVPALLAQLDRLLAPSGTLVISLPVEIGLPLLVKQVARRVAGWRGLGDYPGIEPYSARDLWAGLVADDQPHMQRTVHTGDDGLLFHDHRGFNWRLVRAMLLKTFEIEKTLASPVSWLGPSLASQVWLVAKRRRI